jgi:hypothetical protein
MYYNNCSYGLFCTGLVPDCGNFSTRYVPRCVTSCQNIVHNSRSFCSGVSTVWHSTALRGLFNPSALPVFLSLTRGPFAFGTRAQRSPCFHVCCQSLSLSDLQPCVAYSKSRFSINWNVFTWILPGWAAEFQELSHEVDLWDKAWTRDLQRENQKRTL